MAQYDIVDVHITSQKSVVDAILQDPLLDGQKKYTVEVTEFTLPLGAEGPLEPLVSYQTYDFMALFEVRRKVAGVNPGADGTRLRDVTDIGPTLRNFEFFRPTSNNSIRTPADIVFYIQEHFDNIKLAYVSNAAGLVAAEHGGGANITPAALTADDFVKVNITPNGTIRIFFSNLFSKHFFLNVESYSRMLLGFTESVVAFRQDGANQTTGLTALTDGTLNVVAGEPGETAVLQGLYPLTRYFDHRVRVEFDNGGMPIPNVVEWTTNNKQSIRHTIATFPINQEYKSSVSLNRAGAADGNTRFTSTLLQGDIVWRRAESKVSERFQILNSQFFQNIRAEVIIVRREWDKVNRDKFIFVRRAITIEDGESWTAKLRFRTIK